VDHDTRRLKSLIEMTTNAVAELRRWDDPMTSKLIADLERVRAESGVALAIGACPVASLGGRGHN
jgi:hypothetical protein